MSPYREVPASLSSDGKLRMGPENSRAEDGIWPCYASVDWSHFQTVFLASVGKCGLETRLVSRSTRLFAS